MLYSVLSWLFGLTFGVKLLEKQEDNDQHLHSKLIDK